MKKKIVLVETEKFIKERFKQIALEEGDTVYFLEGDNKDNEDKKYYIYCDLKSDFDKATDLIEQKLSCKPDAIITVNESVLTQTVKLANVFGVSSESVDSVHTNRDKFEMKKVWMNKNVLTAKSKLYRSVKEVQDGIEEIDFPVIIKPSQGYASVGVKKVENKTELIEQVTKVFLLNFTVITKEKLGNTGILIEEYIDGEEFSVDTLWLDGKPLISGVLARDIPEGPYYPDRLYFIDTEMSENVYEKIKEASYAAVKATGLKNGASHTELRLKNDNIYIIETTSRPGAGGYFFEFVFKEGYKVDFTKVFYLINVIDDRAELNKRIDELDLKIDEKECMFMYNLPYKGKGIIKAIHGLEELKQRPEVIECTCFKKPGDILYDEDMNAGYLVWITGHISQKNVRDELKKLQKIYDNCISVEYV